MAPRSGILFAITLALVGCNAATQQDAQYDDTRNPYYKQAQQALDNNDPTGAAAAYEAALAANPKLVTAQYQLGVLYGEKLQDPVSSIFHFRRFLELAPESDHAANAKDKIEQETQAFAASLPAQNSDELTKLQADNASLHKQVEEAANTIGTLQAQLAKATKHHHDATATTNVPVPETPATPGTPPPAADTTADAAGTPPAAPVDATPPAAVAADTTAPSAPATPAAPPRALPLDATNTDLTPIAPGTPLPPGVTPPTPAGPSRSYTVAKGDSIWKIAHKMYPGDTKNGVDKIQEANKDAIGGRPLKIGQVLVIPQ